MDGFSRAIWMSKTDYESKALYLLIWKKWYCYQ